jgi:hypothetical protein
VADGPIRANEAPKAGTEPMRALQPTGLGRALTRSLKALTAKLSPRYENKLEISAPPAPPAEKPSLMGRIGGFFAGMKDSVVSTISDAAAATRDFFVGAARTVKDKGVLGAVSQWAGQAWEGVKAAGNWVGDKIAETWNNAIKSVTGFFSKVWSAFTQHQRQVDKVLDERKREQDRVEEQRYLARRDEAKHLEETVQKARDLASAQDVAAQQGLVDKASADARHSQVDNAAIARRRAREQAQKAQI